MAFSVLGQKKCATGVMALISVPIYLEGWIHPVGNLATWGQERDIIYQCQLKEISGALSLALLSCSKIDLISIRCLEQLSVPLHEAFAIEHLTFLEDQAERWNVHHPISMYQLLLVVAAYLFEKS